MSDGMSKKLSGWKKGRPCFFVNPFLIWFHVGYPSPDDLISLLNVNQDLALKKPDDYCTQIFKLFFFPYISTLHCICQSDKHYDVKTQDGFLGSEDNKIIE